MRNVRSGGYWETSLGTDIVPTTNLAKGISNKQSSKGRYFGFLIFWQSQCQSYFIFEKLNLTFYTEENSINIYWSETGLIHFLRSPTKGSIRWPQSAAFSADVFLPIRIFSILLQTSAENPCVWRRCLQKTQLTVAVWMSLKSRTSR